MLQRPFAKYRRLGSLAAVILTVASIAAACGGPSTTAHAGGESSGASFQDPHRESHGAAAGAAERLVCPQPQGFARTASGGLIAINLTPTAGLHSTLGRPAPQGIDLGAAEAACAAAQKAAHFEHS